MAFKMKGTEFYGKLKLNRNMDDSSRPDGRTKSSAFQKKDGFFRRLHKKMYDPEQKYAGSSKSPADAKRERERDPRYQQQLKRDRERYKKGETLSNPSNKARFIKEDKGKKIDEFAKKHWGVGKEKKGKKLVASKGKGGKGKGGIKKPSVTGGIKKIKFNIKDKVKKS